MQYATVRVFFGLAWILLGILSVRRAYIGEKPGALITLTSSNHLMNRRERMIALFLGGANLLLGIADLVFARK